MSQPTPQRTQTPLLELRDVSKSFGAVQALRGVQMQLFGGEAHALYLENGAGKSTLTKVLAGVHRTPAGGITPFLREDGLLVGRADDLAQAQAAMEATAVNGRWQAEMRSFFVDLRGGRPDRGMHVLEEVFHLETQLRDAGLPPTPEASDQGAAPTTSAGQNGVHR